MHSLWLKGDWPFCLSGLARDCGLLGKHREASQRESKDACNLVHQTHLFGWFFPPKSLLRTEYGFYHSIRLQEMFTECQDKYHEARKHASRRSKRILCHWLLRWEPPSKYWSITPATGVMGLTTICNSTLRGSSASFWLLKALHGYGAQKMQAKFYIQKESYSSFLYMVFQCELVSYHSVWSDTQLGSGGAHI